MAEEITTTSENLHAHVEEVLYPEEHTTDYAVLLYRDAGRTKPFKVTLRLYPLPVKSTRHIGSLTKKVEKGEIADNAEISDLLLDITTFLFSIYKVQGVSKEVVQNSMDIEDMYKLVSKQLEVCRNSDFLLLPLAGLLRIIEGMEKGRENLGQLKDAAANQIGTGLPPDPDQNPEQNENDDAASPEQKN